MPIRSFLLLFSTLLLTGSAIAQDRIFTRSYQSGVLPKGAIEIEYWSTYLSGRENFHRELDQRLELELGLGRNVQTAFYLNIDTRTEIVHDSVLNSVSSAGFSNEWKFKLSDPVANAVGSALYAEIGFSGNEAEIETKLILDKKFGKNVVAFNLISEIEFESEYEAEEKKVETEIETPVTLTFAYLRLVGNSFGVGFEAENHNAIGEDGWENSLWYAGPTLHFNGNRWWINVNVSPQLFNSKQTIVSPDTYDDVHYDRVDARVILSFTL